MKQFFGGLLAHMLEPASLVVLIVVPIILHFVIKYW
jgi:hypothetical protein